MIKGILKFFNTLENKLLWCPNIIKKLSILELYKFLMVFSIIVKLFTFNNNLFPIDILEERPAASTKHEILISILFVSNNFFEKSTT